MNWISVNLPGPIIVDIATTRGPMGPRYRSPESLSGGEDVYHKI